MTNAEALRELARIADSIDEPDDSRARAARLLERVSTRADSLELRAALTELGALTMVHAMRALVDEDGTLFPEGG